MKLRTRLEFISLESLYAVTLLSWGSGIIKNYASVLRDNYVAKRTLCRNQNSTIGKP
jgi:hypothetical protein